MKKFAYTILTIVFSVFCFLPCTFSGTQVQQKKKIQFNPDPAVLINNLLENHQEIQTFQHRVESARARVQQSKGLYYPSINVRGDAGREDVRREYQDETIEFRHEIALKASQLITDFGRTLNSIKKDKVSLQQAKAGLASISQQMMRSGIIAYINIVKARERLETAIHSEKRIKELTGIEKALVQKGAGLTSDVLQAKSQLAGAMAQKVEARGQLNLAKNRFEAVFYHFPTSNEINKFFEINFPKDKLPDSLEDAIQKALKNNPELRITRLDVNLARKQIDISKSAFFPALSLFAEAIDADNNSGTLGYRQDFSAGIEFSYNILRGGSDKAAFKNALANRKAASTHLEHAYAMITEQVRNSWEQLLTFKQRQELLFQQTDILKNFLELAKKERKMGTRSLLDVLNGEVNYINARGAAISAREDTKIAAFSLLFSMGMLDLDLFSQK